MRRIDDAQGCSRIGALICALSVATTACSGARAGAPPAALPAPSAPNGGQSTIKPSTECCETGKSLSSIRAGLDSYERGTQPKVVGTGLGEMMDGVQNWVALAAKDPEARAALEAHRGELAREILVDPVKVSIRKVEVYVEICGQTGSESDALALLREITSKHPSAVQVRTQLILLLLQWLKTKELYSDISANQDVLESHLGFAVRLAKSTTERARRDVSVLYEALLAGGKLAEARALSERALELGAECDTLYVLVRSAEHQRVNAEADRLRDKMKEYGGCAVTKKDGPSP